MSSSATTAPAEGPAGGGGAPRLTAAKARVGERIVLALLALCGLISVLTTVGIVVVLFVDAGAFFRDPDINFMEFLTDTEWRPFTDPSSDAFRAGVLPLLNGTFLVTAIAMLIAVPLGLGTAMYLSEYAPPRVRKVLKPVLEVLAGIPTVVLGFFALTFMTPVLRAILGQGTVSIFNAGSAGIVMGIMVVPTIASVAQDAMSAVPQALRDGAFGLGASKRHVTRKVVFPAALSGIVAAVILGFGRAIGETMIVAIAAGNLPTITANPFSQVQTMTAYIVQAVSGEAPRGSATYQSIFAVGAMLFLLTFFLNVIAQRFVRRYREVY